MYVTVHIYKYIYILRVEVKAHCVFTAVQLYQRMISDQCYYLNHLFTSADYIELFFKHRHIY